jgi:hypothetical protein
MAAITNYDYAREGGPTPLAGFHECDVISSVKKMSA